MKGPWFDRRHLPLLRFPLILFALASLVIWSEWSLNRVAEDINLRMYYSGRLEESARLETESHHFFEAAEFYVAGIDGVTRDDVEMALNLLWSRATVMATPSFRKAMDGQFKDTSMITELVEALPEFEAAMNKLKPGDEDSYKPLALLSARFSRRLSEFGEQAWNLRQERMARSVELGLQSVSMLRWVQSGFGIISVFAMLYVIAELFISRRMNGRLNRAIEEKQKMLRRDHLTGIGNRFRFEEVLSRLLAEGETNFSVLYFDLDGFKLVNDEHGHAAGDRLLCHVAACLQEGCGTMDQVARFGGDEFAVLLHGNETRARSYAETVLLRVARPVLGDASELPGAASAGICHVGEVAPGNSSMDELMRCADMALYAAKNAGRNCIRVFSAAMVEEFVRLREEPEEEPVEEPHTSAAITLSLSGVGHA